MSDRRTENGGYSAWRSRDPSISGLRECGMHSEYLDAQSWC